MAFRLDGGVRFHITQAIFPGCCAKRDFRLSMLLYRNCTVRSRMARGIPADIGVSADEPVIHGKKWLIRAAGDDVAARVGARQPDCAAGGVRSVLCKLDHLRVRNQTQQFLRTFELDRGGPCEIVSQEASACGRLRPLPGRRGPELRSASPIPYSMNSLPSTSQTWQPSPRTINPGES